MCLFFSPYSLSVTVSGFAARNFCWNYSTRSVKSFFLGCNVFIWWWNWNVLRFNNSSEHPLFPGSAWCLDIAATAVDALPPPMHNNTNVPPQKNEGDCWRHQRRPPLVSSWLDAKPVLRRCPLIRGNSQTPDGSMSALQGERSETAQPCASTTIYGD